MKINNDDQNILQNLCREYSVDVKNLPKLLCTVQEYYPKDKRFGVYDTLEEIIKQKDCSYAGKE
ncbi:MAG: hypothetical protein ABFC98_02485 [Candidatus Cloacimonas sp.]